MASHRLLVPHHERGQNGDTLGTAATLVQQIKTQCYNLLNCAEYSNGYFQLLSLHKCCIPTLNSALGLNATHWTQLEAITAALNASKLVLPLAFNLHKEHPLLFLGPTFLGFLI